MNIRIALMLFFLYMQLLIIKDEYGEIKRGTRIFIRVAQTFIIIFVVFGTILVIGYKWVYK